MNARPLNLKRQLSSVIVNMKLSERCNLNCSYCYYYADAYAEVYQRPPLMTLDVCDAAVAFLEKSCQDFEIDELVIAFHGGEPTLLKARIFRVFCQRIVLRLSGMTGKLHLLMQTNGVHLTPEWVDVISEFNIHVGVSLDGPPEYNDRSRLDHQGAGSYARIRQTIAKLKDLHSRGSIRDISAIAVLNNEFDYKLVYSHFVNELDLRLLNFLLPDHSVDSLPYTDAQTAHFGQQLCEMFDLWLEKDQERVHVKQFSDLFQKIALKMKQKYSGEIALGDINIVIHSDGDIALNDSYMAAVDWYKEQASFNVASSSFEEWMAQPIMADICQAYNEVPDDCLPCRFSGICRGGDLEHRFSKERRFNNKSAYCAALFKLYSHVENTLVDGGYPFSEDRPLAQSPA